MEVQDILERIIYQNKILKNLCYELELSYDDQVPIQWANSMTILELDQYLDDEIERLKVKMRKRLAEFHQLRKVESELCYKLVMETTEFQPIIPSESDISALRARCKELERLEAKRRCEMKHIQDECMALSNDLGLKFSLSDTTAVLLFLQSIDNMSLGEDDIKQAIDFREELLRQNSQVVSEIASLRVEIEELWSKLNITNDHVNDIMEAAAELAQHQTSSIKKRTIIEELYREYDRCVQIKMEN